LFGRNITKRTQNAGSAVRKGIVRGTGSEQNLVCIFWVAIRYCFNGFFRLFNSVQSIIISVLRSDVAYNCSQGQPSMMVLLAAAILNRKARTERNMWDGKWVEGKTDKTLSGKCLSLSDLHTKCCGLLIFCLCFL